MYRGFVFRVLPRCTLTDTERSLFRWVKWPARTLGDHQVSSHYSQSVHLSQCVLDQNTQETCCCGGADPAVCSIRLIMCLWELVLEAIAFSLFHMKLILMTCLHYCVCISHAFVLDVLQMSCLYFWVSRVGGYASFVFQQDENPLLNQCPNNWPCPGNVTESACFTDATAYSVLWKSKSLPLCNLQVVV